MNRRMRIPQGVVWLDRRSIAAACGAPLRWFGGAGRVRGTEGLHRMSAEQPIVREHGNAYNLFILLLTVFSLVVMAAPGAPARPADAPAPVRVRQRRLRDLPDGLRLQHHRLAAEAPVLHQPARLARPAGLDPGIRPLPAQRVVAARPPQPAGPDHAPAARQRAQGARPRHGREPRAVRDVHHDPRRGRP